MNNFIHSQPQARAHELCTCGFELLTLHFARLMMHSAVL